MPLFHFLHHLLFCIVIVVVVVVVVSVNSFFSSSFFPLGIKKLHGMVDSFSMHYFVGVLFFVFVCLFLTRVTWKRLTLRV